MAAGPSAGVDLHDLSREELDNIEAAVRQRAAIIDSIPPEASSIMPPGRPLPPARRLSEDLMVMGREEVNLPHPAALS